MNLLSRIFALPSGWSPAKGGFCAAFLLAFGIFLLIVALDLESGYPKVSELSEARGQVKKVWSEKYGIKFRLQGRDEVFDYISKARPLGVVESALRTAGDKEAVVLFEPTPRQPKFSDDSYYTVWQLTVDGQAIRTFDQTLSRFRSDNQLLPWMIAFLLITGVGYGTSAIRARQLQPFR